MKLYKQILLKVIKYIFENITIEKDSCGKIHEKISSRKFYGCSIMGNRP